MEQTWISEIGQVIINLIESGGEQAITALLWYFGYLILRVAMIGGIICLVIHSVFKGVLSLLKIYGNFRERKITMLSEEVSKTFQDSFNEVFKHLSDVVNRLEDHLKTLETPCDPSNYTPESTEEQSSDG